MSLGIVIANIAGPVRQFAPAIVSAPAVAVSENTVLAAPHPGNGIANATANATANETAIETASASSPALTASVLTASQPQLTSNFTLVVLQLLNEQGVVTATIPSAQQLAAYRAGTATPQS